MPAELGRPRLHVREVDIHVRSPVKYSFQFLNALGELLREPLDSLGPGFEQGGLCLAKNGSAPLVKADSPARITMALWQHSYVRPKRIEPLHRWIGVPKPW
jgi:hypothetical protein